MSVKIKLVKICHSVFVFLVGTIYDLNEIKMSEVDNMIIPLNGDLRLQYV